MLLPLLSPLFRLLETLCKLSVHSLTRLHSSFPSRTHPTTICREPPVSRAPGARHQAPGGNFKSFFPERLSHLRGKQTCDNSYGGVLPQEGTGRSQDPGRERIRILRKWPSGPAGPHRAFLALPPAGSSPQGRDAHSFSQERASQARPLPDEPGPRPATPPWHSSPQAPSSKSAPQNSVLGQQPLGPEAE